jgi:hypothetical protein
VHGATFPSALSIAHRFNGISWRDALNEAGALDFYGFGHSDRYHEMEEAAEANTPLCNAQDAAEQVEAAADSHNCRVAFVAFDADGAFRWETSSNG